MNYTQQVKELLKQHNGTLRTSELARRAIPRIYLTQLEKSGKVERVARGVYVARNSLEDDMLSLQSHSRRAIYSHETALYLHDLTDRVPLAYSFTVPSGYHATILKNYGCKVYFIKPVLHGIGLAALKTPHGNEVAAYDAERTICDVLRSRNRIDVQIVNDALKMYVARKDKNLAKLGQYAEALGMMKIVRQYIGVLL